MYFVAALAQAALYFHLCLPESKKARYYFFVTIFLTVNGKKTHNSTT
jgi:hypothetical protein